MFASPDDAADAIAKQSAFFRECHDDYVVAIQTQAASGDGLGSLDTVEVTDLGIEDVGDGVFSLRIAAAANGQQFIVDFVTVREGSILATLAVGGERSYEEERGEFLELLSKRAADANAELMDAANN